MSSILDKNHCSWRGCGGCPFPPVVFEEDSEERLVRKGAYMLYQ